jgi:hypothetical protein
MAVSTSARIAALREAGYQGRVDCLGFADSGDRVADMARNYWAGRDARQKEEVPVNNSQGGLSATGNASGAGFDVDLTRLLQPKPPEPGAPQPKPKIADMEIGG